MRAGQGSESPGGGGTHQRDQLWRQGKLGQQGIPENSTCGSCGPGVPAGPTLPLPRPSPLPQPSDTWPLTLVSQSGVWPALARPGSRHCTDVPEKRKEIKPLNHSIFFRFWRNSQSLACVFRVGLVMDEFPPRSSCVSRHGRGTGASQRVSLMFKISFGLVFLASANFQPRSKGSFHFWSWKPWRKQSGWLWVSEQGHSGERTPVLAGASVGADEVVSWNGASCPRVHMWV